MLYEFGKITDPKNLPKKRKYLHWYIVGLSDAEGCFSIPVKKQRNTRFGYVIDPVFHIVQSKKGREILHIVKEVFNCGRVEKKHGQENTFQYIVDNRKLLKEKIIPFFEKYPLIVKRDEFKIFKEVVERLEKKEHTTKEGFIRILSLAYRIRDEKYRKRELSALIKEIKGRESSEAIRRGSCKKDEQSKAGT